MATTTTGRCAGRRGGRALVFVATLLLTACGGAVSSERAQPSTSPSSSTSQSASPSTSPIGDEPVRSTTPSPSRNQGCAAAPVASTGPAAAVASVQLTVPRTAPSGGAVPARSTVVVHADAPRVVLLPASSGLAVLRGATLVGWTGGSGTSPVPLPLSAGASRPAQVVPDALTLVACDGSPLPAGEYTVQAVVGYGSDALDAAAGGVPRIFHLVSEPVPLTVT